MEMTGDYTEKQNAQFRVRKELTTKIHDMLETFKSDDEPDYELQIKDIVFVFSEMINRTTYE